MWRGKLSQLIMTSAWSSGGRQRRRSIYSLSLSHTVYDLKTLFSALSDSISIVFGTREKDRGIIFMPRGTGMKPGFHTQHDKKKKTKNTSATGETIEQQLLTVKVSFCSGFKSAATTENLQINYSTTLIILLNRLKFLVLGLHIGCSWAQTSP